MEFDILFYNTGLPTENSAITTHVKKASFT